ncbi:hypothetical protein C8F04DRAFT_997489 [Mycena alexandri]|uniref:Novel STAND NTPase 1 domain-containing protein n=1 Tax=Mycena alexandri TaxID=1745969 RepID=A0AAD6T3S0_9AGAR|nr:hypothetical protein C8F04DRAFT_997489 [Mycena alexandri]
MSKMPRPLTVAEIRLNDIIACLEPAIKLLNAVHDTFGTSFVHAIASTATSLVTAIQNVKKNKEECIQLMEHVHEVLYALVNLHIKSETPGSLPPATMHHIGNFMQIIHKIYTFVEAQQEGNPIKMFFRQNEMNRLFKECYGGIQHSLEVFKMESGTTALMDIGQVYIAADSMQTELLELISSISDNTNSDNASSMYPLDGSQLSSESFSMLPAKPKIFYGREPELEKIVQSLSQESARIAILGPGGIGKTSLATAALHHPDIIARYEHRFFVACDSTATSIDMAALIGAHIGIKPGEDLTKPVVQYLSGKPTALLILDNLETAWEPLVSRSGIEELLARLTDINNLALIITMRGAERPAKVHWTHPFLQPLEPLSLEAARQMFIDIAGDLHDLKDIDQLLQLTDKMPLAVDLIAHLVDYDSCTGVLSRWETEKTSLLSAGFDRRSNLDTSIALSLSSPRLIPRPGAKALLSLLSILPDGLSDIELLQGNLPIQDVLTCKALLLGTSLAFINNKKRLQTLVPIREYMQHFHPVDVSLVQPLQKHFHALLNLYQQYKESNNQGPINQITGNFSNLHQILLQGLAPKNPDIVETIRCTISLNNFSRLTGRGWLALMDHISTLLPKPSDHILEVEFIIEVLLSSFYHPTINPDEVITQSLSHLRHLDDQVLECRFYFATALYYLHQRDNVPECRKFLDKALVLAKSIQDTKQQARIWVEIAFIQYAAGEYTTGQTSSTEAQRLARLSANLYEEAAALRMEAICCMNLGDYKHSVSQLHRARELVQLLGLSGSHLDHELMNSEAEVYLLKSEYFQARLIYLQIGQHTSEHNIHSSAYALLNIGEIAAEIGGNDDDEYHNIDKAKTLFGSVEHLQGLNHCETILAEFQLQKGESIMARNTFEKCLEWSWLRDARSSLYCLERMANIGRWNINDLDWSSAYTVVYLAFAKKTQHKLALHKALCFLGDMFLIYGDEGTAESLFIVALSGFTYMDVHHGRANCMLRLGDLAKKHANHARALELWNSAGALFERSSQTKGVKETHARLTDLKERK